MLLDGTILNADINASAAIAGTKISPDFGSQTIVTTGVHSAAAGSAAAPSITFTGDTNTGIYSPGADQVAISTAGSGRLFVSLNGYIGVGNSDPEVAAITPGLVLGNGTDNKGLMLYGTSSSQQNIAFTDTAATQQGLIQYDHSSDYMRFFTASTERLRITSSGLVGVGTSSPISALHVIGEVVAGYSGATKFISLYPGNASQSPAIGFSSADSLRFVGASEYARIDSSGRLLVGTSSTTGNVRAVFSGWGTNPTQQGIVRIQRGSLPTSGQTIADVEFADDSNNLGAGLTAVAEANWVSGTSHPSRLVFSTTADGAASPTERMRIDNAGRVLVGTATANASGAKLQTSDGITFPATQVASADPNTLDDYEEGTWTPVLSDGTNNATMSGSNTGSYTKIGNKVTVYAFVQTTSLESVTGSIRATGLPFQSASATYAGVAATFGSNLAITTGQVVSAYVGASNSVIALYLWDDATGTTPMQATEWSSDGGIVFSLSYRV
jgi:hypothetical protein